MLFQHNFSETEAEVVGEGARGFWPQSLATAGTAGLGQRLGRSISATHIAFKGMDPLSYFIWEAQKQSHDLDTKKQVSLGLYDRKWR